ncbi:ATP-binding protein [Neobacillus sp. Marseille-QA0830]
METNRSPVDYRNLIPKQNGFLFKYVKKDNQFIHTFAEGDFLVEAGLDPAYIVGRSLFDFFPSEVAIPKTAYYEMAWNGTPVIYEGKIDHHYYLASLNPYIVDGITVEVVGTAIDITEEKSTEQKLLQMEKLSLIGELAAGIAHEIRNPLTSITGFAQMMNETIEDTTLKSYLGIMLEELNRINSIVSEFMVIAKPNDQLHFTQTSVVPLINSVLNFMKPQLTLMNIGVTTYFEDSVMAFCDQNQLKQVLINLIQNAIEATTVHHTIDISLINASQESFMIRIRDYGCGISEERQQRLFEPFYTTKEKGTGLGLMVCKRIIENHHGTIDVQTKLNEGTTVTIRLPKMFVE